MPRYIDADQIVYTWLIDADGRDHDGVTLQSVIDMMPTADVRENTYARIVHAGGQGAAQWFKCSECGTPVDVTDSYCKCCGADMRGEA